MITISNLVCPALDFPNKANKIEINITKIYPIQICMLILW